VVCQFGQPTRLEHEAIVVIPDDEDTDKQAKNPN
jgi:hypothetical protein